MSTNNREKLNASVNEFEFEAAKIARLCGHDKKGSVSFLQKTKDSANQVKTLVDQGVLSVEEGIKAVNHIKMVNSCAVKILESSTDTWATRQRIDKIGPVSVPIAHRIDFEETIYVEGPFDTAARYIGLTELPILAKGLIANAQHTVFQFLANSIATSTYRKVTETYQDVQKFHFRVTMWEENIHTGERRSVGQKSIIKEINVGSPYKESATYLDDFRWNFL